MKKYILSGITITLLSLIFTINISVNTTNSNFGLSINEQVEATMHAPDFALHDKPCSNGIIAKVCEPEEGENCDIHAQMTC